MMMVTNADVSETVGFGDMLLAEEDDNSQVTCLYTGVTNLYRCYYKR